MPGLNIAHSLIMACVASMPGLRELPPAPVPIVEDLTVEDMRLVSNAFLTREEIAAGKIIQAFWHPTRKRIFIIRISERHDRWTYLRGLGEEFAHAIQDGAGMDVRHLRWIDHDRAKNAGRSCAFVFQRREETGDQVAANVIRRGKK